jgi:hypothetical protein
MSTFSQARNEERIISVENESYRWAYLFLSYGLLIVVAYRSFVNHESSWDLLLLTVLGGCVSIACQGRKLSRESMTASGLAVVAAALMGTAVVLMRH